MGIYSITQSFLRLGFKLFYRRTHIHNINNVPVDVPVLLVSNHPNSFMDALVIGSYLPRFTNFLARGDAFDKPILAKIFNTYHMLPIYRASEGKENIGKNFETFDATYEAMKRQECLLIFGEGLSEHNWKLRPLKKGPSRIATRAWQSDTAANKMVIIPVGLTYSDYSGADKSVIINYGTPITKSDFKKDLDSPFFTQQLNDAISTQLKQLAYFSHELKNNSAEHHQFKQHWLLAEQSGKHVLAELKLNQHHQTKPSVRIFNKINTTLITLPHYVVSKLITRKLTGTTVFYDSVLFILYWFLMPIYLLVAIGIVAWFC